MKKHFVVTAAIAFGVAAGSALVIGTLAWWTHRGAGQRRAEIRAVYEGAFLDTIKNNRVIAMRYELQNSTTHDITLPASRATLYLRLSDGALIEVPRTVGYKLDDVTVPAGETVAYLVEPMLHYNMNKECKAQPVNKATSTQLTQYVETCVKLHGFFLAFDSPHLRLDMPFLRNKTQ